ncbi:hypothetical protein Mal4_03360 [Maioricimonas rarisocia]|uniref:Nickel uptake substrate-specific transmembrane region n=1 Tax=Maioricimonas rarisocia TaxID=2528026 RepID=A0A517Z0Q2_9PLAN|nr:carboxypeptidase-like regulatory domain-containing protein [Maioricimonas rarisocia]QDU36053.1 hypothetical protein Mal4_03360 [Maioricimonas rarisocia]
MHHGRTCLTWIMGLAVMASGMVPASGGERAAAVRPPADVSLEEDGRLLGRVVDASGRPLDGAVVTIAQKDVVLGRMVTNAKGEFAARGLSSGVYEIHTAQASASYRVWPSAVAPPSAQPLVQLMSGTGPVVRGQLGYIDPYSVIDLGLGVTAVTLSAVAVSRLEGDRVVRIVSP